jgi:hypothetical protein
VYSTTAKQQIQANNPSHFTGTGEPKSRLLLILSLGGDGGDTGETNADDPTRYLKSSVRAAVVINGQVSGHGYRNIGFAVVVDVGHDDAAGQILGRGNIQVDYRDLAKLLADGGIKWETARGTGAICALGSAHELEYTCIGPLKRSSWWPAKRVTIQNKHSSSPSEQALLVPKLQLGNQNGREDGFGECSRSRKAKP